MQQVDIDPPPRFIRRQTCMAKPVHTLAAQWAIQLAVGGCGIAVVACDAPSARLEAASTVSAEAPARSASTNRAAALASAAPTTLAGADAGVPATPDTGTEDGAATDGGAERPVVYLMEGRDLEHDFSKEPLAFTGAFDGSQRFSMWLDTLRFAREIEKKHNERVRFTYFVNACYFDLEVEGSGIGRARSWDEILVRRALTQQAINEGHEVANHSVRHLEGSRWTTAEWRAELTEFHGIMDVALFEPIADDDGGFVFPRFEPLASAAPGAVGAACTSDADCQAGPCLTLTPQVSLCTQPCNRFKKCPEGTACGAPNFHEDTDVCIARPAFPIRYHDRELFNAAGVPSRKHPELHSYRTTGFRAPFLAYGDTLMEVLLDLGYAYDTSIVLPPGPPLRVGLRGDARDLVEFALMPHPDALTVPMDYNYDKAGASQERMVADYSLSLVSAWQDGRRPWNVGHHFAQWRDGAYWKALQETYRFAAAGCLDAAGRKRCPDVDFPSFRELAARLDAAPSKAFAKPVGSQSVVPTPSSEERTR